MSNLQERLVQAAEKAKATQKEIAAAAGVTEAAVSKLFNGKSKEIKAAHVFKIARKCKVDPEWLATGRGTANAAGHATGVRDTKGTYNLRDEFEEKHIDLLRMYKKLPKDCRHMVRSTIQTLAAAQRENYHSWVRELQAELADSDA